MFGFFSQVASSLANAADDERAFDYLLNQRRRAPPNQVFYQARGVPSLAQSRANFDDWTRPQYDPASYSDTPEQRRAMQRYLEESFYQATSQADQQFTRAYTPSDLEVGRDYQYRDLANHKSDIPSNAYPGMPVIYPQTSIWHEEYDLD